MKADKATDDDAAIPNVDVRSGLTPRAMPSAPPGPNASGLKFSHSDPALGPTVDDDAGRGLPGPVSNSHPSEPVGNGGVRSRQSRAYAYGSTSPTPWATPDAGNSSYQYEEFFGGTIQCPSCRGAGRIPREKENELVALIPLSDHRLKPRRTKMYVILAVLICVLFAGLLLFFLFPRTVELKSNMPTLTPTIRYVNQTQQYVFLSVINVFNISNENFFNVEVVEMMVQTFYDTKVIATTTNDTSLSVGMRKNRSYYMHINMTFSQEEGFVAEYCAGKYRYPHSLLLPFQVTMTSKSMGRSEQMTLTTYQHVLCSELKNNTSDNISDTEQKQLPS